MFVRIYEFNFIITIESELGMNSFDMRCVSCVAIFFLILTSLYVNRNHQDCYMSDTYTLLIHYKKFAQLFETAISFQKILAKKGGDVIISRTATWN